MKNILWCLLFICQYLAATESTAGVATQDAATGKTNVIPYGVTGTVLTSTGTGASWQTAVPSMTGQSGKYLTTADGIAASWATISAGTVTSVATSGGLTGGPITSSGTISIANAGVTDGIIGV